jgi:hypothetical protein
MSCDRIWCALCYDTFGDKHLLRIYTCVLTKEEKHSECFDEDDARSKSIATDRFCAKCADGDKNIAKTASGVYYYRNSDERLERKLETYRRRVENLLQLLQLGESDVCMECDKKIDARDDNTSLCGVCGNSLHDFCGSAADKDEEDVLCEWAKGSCSNTPTHSRSITVSLTVRICSSCKMG